MFLALRGGAQERSDVVSLLGSGSVEVGCSCTLVVTVGSLMVIDGILVVFSGILAVIVGSLMVIDSILVVSSGNLAVIDSELVVAISKLVDKAASDGNTPLVFNTVLLIRNGPSMSVPLPLSVELHEHCLLSITNTRHKLPINLALAILNSTRLVVSVSKVFL